MDLVSVEAGSRRLLCREMDPLAIRNFRAVRAGLPETEGLRTTLARESSAFGVSVPLREDRQRLLAG